MESTGAFDGVSNYQQTDCESYPLHNTTQQVYSYFKIEFILICTLEKKNMIQNYQKSTTYPEYRPDPWCWNECPWSNCLGGKSTGPCPDCSCPMLSKFSPLLTLNADLPAPMPLLCSKPGSAWNNNSHPLLHIYKIMEQAKMYALLQMCNFFTKIRLLSNKNEFKVC